MARVRSDEHGHVVSPAWSLLSGPQTKDALASFVQLFDESS